MKRRPNILFIVDDQHRYDWVGADGASWVKTPNIDALAARGMCMTHCHTTSPCQGSYRAIRTRTEKLILTDNDLTELYDMAADPDEIRNVASERPERVRELTRMMQTRFNEHAWLR